MKWVVYFSILRPFDAPRRCALGEGLALCQASDLPADAEGGLLKVLDLGIMSGAVWEATRRWRGGRR